MIDDGISGARPPDESSIAAADGGDTSVGTILIVEDNPANMKLFYDLLTFYGYEVKQARDGEEGYTMACECSPDLILMDIQLPKASGLEVTKWIKEDERLKSIPVIAVTAFAMKRDADRMRDAGCDTYITKPVALVDLVEAVGRYIKAPRTPEVYKPSA